MSRSIYAISFLLLCSMPAGAARQNSSFVPNLIAPENGAVLDNGCTNDRKNDAPPGNLNGSASKKPNATICT
jgi:hypothetical protein